MNVVAAVGAIQAMSRDLRELAQGVRRSPEPPLLAARRSRDPATFARYVDPAGRFDLRYPPTWTIETRADGVYVASPHIGSFARVDIAPADGGPWKDPEACFAREGVKAVIRHRAPTLLRGTIEIGPRRFAWDARAFRSAQEWIVLSIGNVVDPSRSATLGRYEGGVLAAIRRSFLVHPHA